MTSPLRSTVLAFTLLGLAGAAGAGTTWHVDDDAPNDPGPGDPLVSDPLEDGSAARPFDAIQEAIDAASNGDTVLLADGVYTGVGNRALDYGGRLITVRGASGDPDLCVIDPELAARGFLFQSGETAAARLESVTITNGEHPGVGGPGGGAVAIVGASPTIVDCVMIANFAGSLRDGGAVAIDGGAPTFTGCTIEGNQADFDGRGGGCATFDASPTFTDCVFRSNNSIDVNGSRGGALYQVGGTVTLTGCDVSFNSAFIGCFCVGGGLHNEEPFGEPAGTLIVDRCTFRRNKAVSGTCGGTDGGQGGAISGPVTVTNSTFVGNRVTGGENDGLVSWGGAIIGSGTIVNCVFIANLADHGTFGGAGGAVHGSFDIINCTFIDNMVDGPGAAGSAFVGNGLIVNSIFWPFDPDAIVGTSVVASSLVGVDPLFVTPPAPGPDGFWGTDDDVGDARLRAGSPAIDAGDNGALDPSVTTDRDGRPRFVDDPGTPGSGVIDCARPLVDLGAHEFQGATPQAVDVDMNGIVDVDDVIAVILAFGVCPGCPEDLDGNGVVDVDDVIAAILAFDCTPATCAPDCNGNGVPDDEEIWTCAVPDCDGNGVPDECDDVGDDCNGNGVLDACDLDSGTSADCNGNGLPDECDIAAGAVDCDGDGVIDACDPGVDCNGNGVPDACDIAAGAADCNGDGVPDECDPGEDCDGDGVPDECQLAGSDCNRNGVYDPCDLIAPFSTTSGALGPIDSANDVTWTIPGAPTASGDVEVLVEAVADLGMPTQSLAVSLNGVLFVGVVFGPDGSDCPAAPDVAVLTISAANFNAAVAGGDAAFLVTATGVGASCVGSNVTLTVDYLGPGPSEDANGNGVPDECER